MITPAAIVRRLFSGAGALGDLLLPAACPLCDGGRIDAAGLCDRCNVEMLALVSLSYCPRCGATVGPNVPVRDDGCWACPNPLPRFESVIRLGPYAAPLRQAVVELKYRGRQSIRGRLVRMLAQAAAASHAAAPFDLVMPVPMHWRRRLSRGCDHARVLARGLARELHLPLGRELVRIRHTPPQVHLPRTRRIQNVRGAFAVTSAACIEGAGVLLVDDVTTTGATADEAARTLLRAGASRVALAVIAKAEPPRAYAEYVQRPT